MKRRFFIVGRERRRPEQTNPPGEERRINRGSRDHYIGLRDKRVSRRHAEIYVVDDRIFIRDLSSKNGTYLIDGDRKKRLTEAYVDPEHVVSFGGYRQKLSRLIGGSEGSSASGASL